MISRIIHRSGISAVNRPDGVSLGVVMLRNSTLALILSLLLAGCGGDTSWYFCSGSDEFCSVDRRVDDGQQDDEEDEEQAVTASALALSRKIPGVVQDGLAVDALQSTLATSPDLVAGWIMAGSLGVLADDSDDAAVSAFLDANRYWLTVNDSARVDSPEMLAGLRLFVNVAGTRDPEMSAAANRLISDSAVPVILASEDVDAQARTLVAGVVDSECCQAPELMAAAVLLCDRLIESGSTQSAAPSVSAGCASAERWLSAFPAGSVR